MRKRDNAHAWYEYALRTGDDSVARFMMHWIAFNWIYCNSGPRSEKRQIERLCEMRYEDLRRYDPFSDAASIEVFMRLPVLDGRGASHRHDDPRRPSEMDPWQLHEAIRNCQGLERIQCLLLAIYQVRCNLFHGSKDPDDMRDLELVRSSATIMQGYMEALLHITPPVRDGG